MNCIYCGKEVKGNIRKDCDIICRRCTMRLVKYIQGLEREFKTEIKNKKWALALEQKRYESLAEKRKKASKGSILSLGNNSSLRASQSVLKGNFEGVSDSKKWWEAWKGIDRNKLPVSWDDLLRDN